MSDKNTVANGQAERRFFAEILRFFNRLVSWTGITPRLYVVADLNAAQTLATVTTVTTVTTCGTLTSLTNWGTLTASQKTIHDTRMNYDNGPRSRVSAY